MAAVVATVTGITAVAGYWFYRWRSGGGFSKDGEVVVCRLPLAKLPKRARLLTASFVSLHASWEVMAEHDPLECIVQSCGTGRVDLLRQSLCAVHRSAGVSLTVEDGYEYPWDAPVLASTAATHSAPPPSPADGATGAIESKTAEAEAPAEPAVRLALPPEILWRAIAAAVTQGHNGCLEILFRVCTPTLSEATNPRDLARGVLAAVKRNNVQCIQMLLHRGLIGRDEDDNPRLRQPAANGHPDMLALILPMADMKTLRANPRALELAAKHGRADCVRLLLPHCDARAHDSKPLQLAVFGGHAECVELLLPESDARAGESIPLQYAAEMGDSNCVAVLLPFSDPLAANSAALRRAAKQGHIGCVSLLAPVSNANDIGPSQLLTSTTALIEAVEGGHAGCVRELLPHSDPRVLDSLAIRRAAFRGHADIVRLLIPASDCLAGYCGALCAAASAGHADCVDMLIPHSDTAGCNTALLRAVQSDYQECVRLLLEKEGAPTDPGSNGYEILRIAASIGRTRSVERLIPLCDATVKRNRALRVAAQNGHAGCVEVLIPVSDPKDMNSEALYLAAKHGRTSCVELLLPVSDPFVAQSRALRVAKSRNHRACIAALRRGMYEGVRGLSDSGSDSD